MPEFILVHHTDLNPGETPRARQCHNLEHSLAEAWHISNSRGAEALVSLNLGNRVIYDRAALLALMERISEMTGDANSVEQASGQIAQGRKIDEETFQSICDEVRQSLPETIFRNDVTLEERRRSAIGALLRYARQYLGNSDPGRGVPPSGGSNFYSRYNALAQLVEHRASPHFSQIPLMEAFMEGIFGAKAWVDEPDKS